MPSSELEIMDSILPSNSSSNNSSSNNGDIIAAEAAAASVVARIHHYEEYQQNNTPPPLWTESTTIDTPNIHTELLYTYKYPRLYLNDPTTFVQRQNYSSSNTNSSTSWWWLELGQRMQTTLKHVNYEKWRGRAIQQSVDQLHLLRNNNSICVDSSEEEELSFCNGNLVAVTSSQPMKLMQQQQQQQKHGRSRSDHPFCIATVHWHTSAAITL
jgi:hypothetical protein